MTNDRLKFRAWVEDVELSRNRIVEKLKLKPNWYRWTNRKIPKYVEDMK